MTHAGYGFLLFSLKSCFTFFVINIILISCELFCMRPIFADITAQTGTYTYKAAQVVAKYRKPPCSGNNYIIKVSHVFKTTRSIIN